MAKEKLADVHNGVYTEKILTDFSWIGNEFFFNRHDNLYGSLDWGGRRLLHTENEKLLMKIGSEDI